MILHATNANRDAHIARVEETADMLGRMLRLMEVSYAEGLDALALLLISACRNVSHEQRGHETDLILSGIRDSVRESLQ